MASASSGVRVAASVDFGAIRADSNIRAVRLSVTGASLDQIVETSRASKTGNGEAHDFDKLLPGLAEPEAGSYILFRLDNGKWCLIMWCPEGKLRVKERMVLASSQDAVRQAFGDSHVQGEFRFGAPDEFSHAHALGGKGPSREECLSTREVEINKVKEAEETARREMAEMRGGAAPKQQPSWAVKASATASSSSSSASSTPSWVKPQQQQTSKVGGTALADVPGAKRSQIGGYHSVALPWDSSAEEAVASIVRGDLGLAHLEIRREPTDTVFGVASGHRKGTVSKSDLSSAIRGDEPGFYIWVESSAPSAVFIYSCPTASRARNRMVYSTAKTSVSGKAESLGVRVSKSIEISDPNDVASAMEPAPRAHVYGGGGGGGGGMGGARSATGSPSSRMSVVGGQHPVYGLIGAKEGPSGPRKKIVLPPKHAYG